MKAPVRPASTLPPQLTPLLGRTGEVEAARRLLVDDAVRLLTLTGPGGSGKTRLALAVAETVRTAFPHGVRLVDLTPLRDPALVPSAIARALGVPEVGGRPILEQLTRHLRERHLLLTLDNFEQVLPAAAVLNELLGACPHLVLLVTSREPLHLRAEHQLPVPPLAMPDHGRPLSEEIAQPSLAVALFVERARAVRPDFALTESNAAAVAELCVRLDGLPLAIELAAARSGVLAPEALLPRFEHRLPLLQWKAADVPERHRTLRATFGWSYGLLDDAEQALFRRLGVFAGGWTVGAAEAVVGASELGLDGLEGLTSLADKSLVQVIEPPLDGEPRFRLLETVREFALAQLAASGELEEARCRHAAYFLELAERAGPELLGPEQGAWFRRLDREDDDLRAALDWAAERGETDTELRLAAALRYFWLNRGHVSEGRRRLEAALARNHSVPGTARAQALTGCALLTFWQNDCGRARLLLDEALALGRALRDARVIAESLAYLTWLADFQADLERAVALSEEGLAVARAAGDDWASGLTLQSLGVARLLRDELERVESLLAESLALFRGVGDIRNVAITLATLSLVPRSRGDRAAATAMLAEALALCRELEDIGATAYTATIAADLLVARGDPERVPRLLAALDLPREAANLTDSAPEHVVVLHAAATTQAALGESACAPAWVAGGASSPAQVAEEVLTALAASPPAGRVPEQSAAARRSRGPLTEREREVLRLVADGLTNVQIAEHLVVTPRTAKFHVASILHKLRADTRAQAVALALQQGLLNHAAGCRSG